MWGVSRGDFVKITKGPLDKIGRNAIVVENEICPLPFWPWGKFFLKLIGNDGEMSIVCSFKRWEFRRLSETETDKVWNSTAAAKIGAERAKEDTDY